MTDLVGKLAEATGAAVGIDLPRILVGANARMPVAAARLAQRTTQRPDMLGWRRRRTDRSVAVP